MFWMMLFNFYRCDFLTMFQKTAKHRANDASNDVHRPPLEERALPQGGRSLVSLFSKYFFHLDLLQSTASPCIMPSYAIRTWELWMKIWHVKNMPIWTSIWEECVSHQIIGFLACGDTFTNVKCKTHSCLTEGNFPFLPIFSNEQKKRPHCTWLLWSGVILWKLRQSATLRVSHMCRQATPLSSSLHLSPL